MRNLFPILLVLAALPAAAGADERRCAHEAQRAVQLDLDGVRTVRLVTGQHTVRAKAAAGASHRIAGRACASSAALLQQLELVQEKQGDTLVVATRGPAQRGGLGMGAYARLDVAGTVPDDVLVQLVVGSGDGFVEGVASASADVGSGDASLRGVRGAVTAKVGSGDLEVTGSGPLKLLSLGSGDVVARDVRGEVEVGDIGSGDLVLADVRGGVRIDGIGSGNARLQRVGGPVRVGSIGSGDLDVRGAPALEVRHVGSGDISHRDVGRVELPRRD